MLSLDAFGHFFVPRNYIFSTKTPNARETLYFADGKRTGRLRQEHPSGPVARIDRRRKTRLFLSKKRFAYLNRWHNANRGKVPRYYNYERQPKDGKYHIEFVREGRQSSGWHYSRGIVCTGRHSLDRRINSALESILGVGSERHRS